MPPNTLARLSLSGTLLLVPALTGISYPSIHMLGPSNHFGFPQFQVTFLFILFPSQLGLLQSALLGSPLHPWLLTCRRSALSLFLLTSPPYSYATMCLLGSRFNHRESLPFSLQAVCTCGVSLA
jgi:hypothetical protein